MKEAEVSVAPAVVCCDKTILTPDQTDSANASLTALGMLSRPMPLLLLLLLLSQTNDRPRLTNDYLGEGLNLMDCGKVHLREEIVDNY